MYTPRTKVFVHLSGWALWYSCCPLCLLCIVLRHVQSWQVFWPQEFFWTQRRHWSSFLTENLHDKGDNKITFRGNGCKFAWNIANAHSQRRIFKMIFWNILCSQAVVQTDGNHDWVFLSHLYSLQSRVSAFSIEKRYNNGNLVHLVTPETMRNSFVFLCAWYERWIGLKILEILNFKIFKTCPSRHKTVQRVLGHDWWTVRWCVSVTVVSRLLFRASFGSAQQKPWK